MIRHNKVFRFGTNYRSGVRFVYVGVDKVNYGVGQVNVVGNVVRKDDGDDGGAADVGLAYYVHYNGAVAGGVGRAPAPAPAPAPALDSGRGAGAASLGLELLSASNHVQLGPNGVQRELDPAVTVVTPL